MPDPITLTHEMLILLAILVLTLYLFISEIVRIDTAALIIMVLLGLLNHTPGIQLFLTPELLFSGFSSNAVLSIIGIMIIGAGLDKTGVMTHIAETILKFGLRTERRIVIRLTCTVGLISGFMQNVGTTALFLPVVNRIASHTQIPQSRLLIPTGFCAILGGTLTMVGCSSLIILNDLINNSQTMPSRNFTLFEVTPIGLALLLTGILFFTLTGKVLLPAIKSSSSRNIDALKSIYNIQAVLYETEIPQHSPIAGLTIRQIENDDHAPHILSISSHKQTRMSPNRDDIIWPTSTLLILGQQDDLLHFARINQLQLQPITSDSNKEAKINPRLNMPDGCTDASGISEVVIRPGSQLIGKSIGDVRFRKYYNLNLLGLHRGQTTHQTRLRSLKLQSGDTLIFYSRWKDLATLAKNKDFIIASDYPHETMQPEKLPHALTFFALAMSLILLTDLPLPLTLLSGALGMIIFGVLDMDEAYRAISWKTIFLLAGLIPLGIAVNQTGTAAWISQQLISQLNGNPAWVIQSALAILATAFTLVMSNVGATVLLVPIALNLAHQIGADPSVFALTVALATSNSFLIPTHQVNALIMGPGGYKVSDFARVGGIMSVLYLLVLIPMLNWVF